MTERPDWPLRLSSGGISRRSFRRQLLCFREKEMVSAFQEIRTLQHPETGPHCPRQHHSWLGFNIGPKAPISYFSRPLLH